MSMSEFFYMGGYAGYVWFSYGLTVVLFVMTWLMPVMQRKATLKKLARRLEKDDQSKI